MKIRVRCRVRVRKGRTRHDRYTTAAHLICKSQDPGSSPDHGAGVRVAWCHRPRESLSASFVMVAQPQREREHRWLRLDGRMVWQSQTS